ncbi:MAG: helix-turn-helix domain-containing protein [Gemmatimonadota bacterium]|nr:helix-turn-helix domain-containing protein [Gemmatimonadota bacterium]
MEITDLLTDETVLSEIGSRLARRRIDMGLTQASLAVEAGVAKRTVERIESGKSAQTSSLVRILRVLDLLPGLDSLIPEVRPSPLELLKRKGRVRERAPSPRRSAGSSEPWTWGEES